MYLDFSTDRPETWFQFFYQIFSTSKIVLCLRWPRLRWPLPYLGSTFQPPFPKLQLRGLPDHIFTWLDWSDLGNVRPPILPWISALAICILNKFNNPIQCNPFTIWNRFFRHDTWLWFLVMRCAGGSAGVILTKSWYSKDFYLNVEFWLHDIWVQAYWFLVRLREAEGVSLLQINLAKCW